MNELTINLQTKAKEPLYEQIYHFIKTEIQKGKIVSGEKLPSTRALSRHLEVSRSTVELAYEQLLSEGYIESVQCKGYFVAQIEELYQLQVEHPASVQSGHKEQEIYQYDFSPNGVDLKSFPYNIWRKLSKECLVDDKAELFRLGDSKGEAGLRNAIAHYLYQARGVNCNPEQIVIGAGTDYLHMLLATMIGSEHKIAMENPTYKHVYRLFRNLSYQVETVGMDANGMQVSELEQTDADIAFVMPSHQYPLGTIMPIKRRMELLKWANRKEGRYIIEDDYDSEFRYKGKPIPALQGYDRHGKVIYIGTFSKSIAPAIRVSYMVLPQEMLKQYEAKSSFVRSTVSKVDQLIIQGFIEQGYYERHLNKTRAMYKARHDTLLTALRPLQKLAEISGENAGVHLLLHLKGGRTEGEMIRLAAEKKVKVYGLSEYDVDGSKRHGEVIMLGYANLSEDNILKAVELLKEAWL